MASNDTKHMFEVLVRKCFLRNKSLDLFLDGFDFELQFPENVDVAAILKKFDEYLVIGPHKRDQSF